MADVARTRMTAAEFFELPETTQITELLDGELIVSPTPVPVHQRLSRRLARLVEDKMPHGEVFTAPLSVYLDEANIPEPDVIWVAANSRCKVGEKYLEGPPDLVIEILSPSTSKRDKEKKFDLYERFEIYEYWIVDPANEDLTVWILEQGNYKRLGVFKSGDTFTSPVLGQAIEVKEIFGA